MAHSHEWDCGTLGLSPFVLCILILDCRAFPLYVGISRMSFGWHEQSPVGFSSCLVTYVLGGVCIPTDLEAHMRKSSGKMFPEQVEFVYRFTRCYLALT